MRFGRQEHNPDNITLEKAERIIETFLEILDEADDIFESISKEDQDKWLDLESRARVSADPNDRILLAYDLREFVDRVLDVREQLEAKKKTEV